MVVASVLLALVVGGAFVILLLAISDVRDAQRRSDHSQNVLIASNALERLLLDLETGQRGFVLTGEARFLQPWSAARRTFPVRAGQLHELVAGNRVEEALVARIVRAGRSYIADYSVPLVAAARRGHPSARSVAATQAGKDRVDALRADFDRLINAEDRTATAAAGRVSDDFHRAVLAAVIALVGSIALIAMYATYLARAIIRPVRRAAEMAGRLAGGDLSVRMAVTGPGEVGTLERAFNVMGSSLERGRHELAALADEQAALRRVATLVARGASPPAVFAAVAEEVGRLLPADQTFVGRYDAHDTATVVADWSGTSETSASGPRLPLTTKDGVARIVHQTGRPARIDNQTGDAAETAERLGIRSSLGAPITLGGRLWGLLLAGTWGDEPAPPGTELRLAGFAELVATAIANAEAQSELSSSRVRLVAAADETRRRIERDLHDGAQQRLVSLGLQLRAVQAAVPPDLEQMATELAQVASGLNAAHDELRELSQGIHPANLTEGGLAPALKTLARRSATPVDVNVGIDGRLPEQVEIGAYYVVSEALANAVKHAHASTVRVEVEAHGRALLICVSDNGVGGAAFAGGSGLVGLRDRVEALGGRLELRSTDGAGTSLSAELPLAPDAVAGKNLVSGCTHVLIPADAAVTYAESES